MFDTHVNLHGDAFSDDLDEVLTRARAAEISRFLAICDRFDSFETVLAIANAHPDIWCSVGVHPHHAKDFTDLAVDTLVEAAADPKVVAIGETGLDLHYNYSGEAEQIASLRNHIQAARKTGLPLILHCRDADDQMGDILESEAAKGSFKFLLHCYTGGLRLRDRALKLNGYFSVSGILSFKNAKNVREVVSGIPTDRVILETDCPYLAPVPYRGRRNEPSYLPAVCKAYADLMGLDPVAAGEITEKNALELFHKVS